MNLYKKNLDFFKNNSHPLYKILTTEESRYASKVTLTASMNMKTEYCHTACFVHSLYDIGREIDQMFSAVSEDVEKLIVFGMGLWIAQDHIYDTYKNVKSIIVIEPDLNVFRAALQRIDFSSIVNRFGSVTVIFNRPKEEISLLLWGLFEHEPTLKTAFVYNLSYRNLYTDDYEYISREFSKKLKDHVTNLTTLDTFLYQWAENAIKNLPYSATPLTQFRNTFGKLPAIIVAAGPSLNYNLESLKKLEHKAVIVAVGSAIKILDSNGISPHFRIAFDPSHFQQKSFAGIDTEAAPLIFSDTIYPPILAEYQGPLIRMMLDNDHLGRFFQKKLYGDTDPLTFASGLSVANVALDAMIKLGFAKIILIGQDLCYTDGSVYAKGSWKTEDKEVDFEHDSNYIRTVNNLGEPVYTNRVLLGMKNLLESQIQSNSNVTYINATEKGLPIEGVVSKSIEKVIEEYLLADVDIRELINRTVMQNPLEKNRPELIAQLALPAEIRNLSKINNNILKRIKKLMRYSQKGLGDAKLKTELAYIQCEIAERLEANEFYASVIEPAIRYKIYASKLTRDLHEQSEARTCDAQIKFLLDSAIILKEYLEFWSELLKE